MAEVIRDALTAALPAADIDTIHEQRTRPGNRTARVTFTDRSPAYVKTATDTAVRLRREIAATRRANGLAVNTPTVIAADGTANRPYLVTEPLAGRAANEPWTGDGDRASLLRQVGRTVAATHRATFERCGVIDRWADGIRLDAGSWEETLCATIAWRADDWLPDRFEGLPGELIETIRSVEPAEPETATLLHGDPSRLNVHVEPNGLLDWERAMVGDPAYDLVETRFHHLDQPDVDDDDRSRLRAALDDGYRAERGHLPRHLDSYEPLYWAVAHLLALQAFDDWGPTVGRPLDEVAADVRAEAHSRMATARDACPTE